jgi:uncharacterized SAM-binding protein YcdF (DUF218 family)
MSFLASKLVSALLVPSTALVFLTILLTLLPQRVGPVRALTVIVALLLAAAAFLPLGQLLLRPLEARFSRPSAPPGQVDGIIMLGGSERTEIAASRDEPATNEHAERYWGAIELARRYPDARLVHAGGSGAMFQDKPAETLVARRWFETAGVDPARITFEGRSRTTFENVVNARELIDPRPDETWLLVTSAFHMPRAVATFRAHGWEVVPWPVDHQTAPFWRLDVFGAVSGRLTLLDIAAHEWFGLLYYRLTGRTDQLLPSRR